MASINNKTEKCWWRCGETRIRVHYCGNVKWYSQCGKKYVNFSKNLQKELSYDPTIQLLGIYPKELKVRTQKGICTPMFVAALLTTPKTLKQLKNPRIDEWTKYDVCICNGMFSALKRKKFLHILQHVWTSRVLC